jgi:hypothetical protein
LIGDYGIPSVAGAGVMGVVYEARQWSLAGIVARYTLSPAPCWKTD